jgi:hypothetical protein
MAADRRSVAAYRVPNEMATRQAGSVAEMEVERNIWHVIVDQSAK